MDIVRSSAEAYSILNIGKFVLGQSGIDGVRSLSSHVEYDFDIRQSYRNYATAVGRASLSNRKYFSDLF